MSERSEASYFFRHDSEAKVNLGNNDRQSFLDIAAWGVVCM